MSHHIERFVLAITPQEAMLACSNAAAEMGWRVMSQDEWSITLKEVAIAVSFTWPAELRILVQGAAGGAEVHVEGSNFGFGPIQSGHVRGQVGNFINRLHLYLSRRSTQDPLQAMPRDLASELETLSRLYQSGALTDAEFAQAKQKLLGSTLLHNNTLQIDPAPQRDPAPTAPALPTSNAPQLPCPNCGQGMQIPSDSGSLQCPTCGPISRGSAKRCPNCASLMHLNAGQCPARGAFQSKRI